MNTRDCAGTATRHAGGLAHRAVATSGNMHDQHPLPDIQDGANCRQSAAEIVDWHVASAGTIVLARFPSSC